MVTEAHDLISASGFTGVGRNHNACSYITNHFTEELDSPSATDETVRSHILNKDSVFEELDSPSGTDENVSDKGPGCSHHTPSSGVNKM